MPHRPQEEALSAVLNHNKFRFMNRHGEVTLPEIYQAVSERYHMLCEDTFTCSHYSRTSRQPEWQHTVRGVLENLKVKGKVIKPESYEIWIFP